MVLVLDSYKPALAVARLPELRATLRTFLHKLVQEELRDRFIGRETMTIIRTKAAIKQEVASQEPGIHQSARVKSAILENSVLAKNLSDIL